MSAFRRVVLVALVALALSGCTLVAPNAAPTSLKKSDVPFGLLHRTIPGTNGVSVHFITQPVYIVDVTNHLAPSSRIVPAPAALQTVIQQLLLGPTAIERSAGYTSALPKTLVLLRANVRDDIGYVDFSTPLTSLTTSLQLLAVGQLVLTADDVGATRGLVIEVRGVRQSILMPNGEHAEVVTAQNFTGLENL